MLALAAGASLGGFAGCSTLQKSIRGCPDEPIIDTRIPPDRRTIQFLDEDNRPVEHSEPPIISFEPTDSRVVIKGVFSGATPKNVHDKDMILVTRLRYDEQSDTLRVHLVERKCRFRGAAVGGETTPYEFRVRFPDSLPGRVCVQERGGTDTEVCVSR